MATLSDTFDDRAIAVARQTVQTQMVYDFLDEIRTDLDTARSTPPQFVFDVASMGSTTWAEDDWIRGRQGRKAMVFLHTLHRLLKARADTGLPQPKIRPEVMDTETGLAYLRLLGHLETWESLISPFQKGRESHFYSEVKAETVAGRDLVGCYVHVRTSARWSIGWVTQATKSGTGFTVLEDPIFKECPSIAFAITTLSDVSGTCLPNRCVVAAPPWKNQAFRAESSVYPARKIDHVEKWSSRRYSSEPSRIRVLLPPVLADERKTNIIRMIPVWNEGVDKASDHRVMLASWNRNNEVKQAQDRTETLLDVMRNSREFTDPMWSPLNAGGYFDVPSNSTRRAWVEGIIAAAEAAGRTDLIEAARKTVQQKIIDASGGPMLQEQIEVLMTVPLGSGNPNLLMWQHCDEVLGEGFRL